MTYPPPRRTPASSALLLLPLLTLACGPSTTGGETKPDLPQVAILVDEPSTVGKSLKLSITSSGCEQVTKLELLNNDVSLKPVTFAGNPTPVELQINEVPYTQGIAANLSLTARVTCSDGRVNVSQAQPATFFPVDEVILPDNATSQVVPDYFVAESSGSSVYFIGCGKTGSRSFLYKVLKSAPASPQSIEMPFECDATTAITDRKGGVRWVWTPNKGAIAINASFKQTGTADRAEQVLRLVITPDGDALVGDALTLQRVSPSGELKWTAQIDRVPGLIVGDPVVRTGASTANTFVVPMQEDTGASTTKIRVGVFSYASGSWQTDYLLESLSPIQSPLLTFDTSGTVLYMSVQGTMSATVRACAVGQPDLCRPGTTTRLWISDDLKGTMAALVPYNNGARLAALTTNRYWFLDARSGSSNAGKMVNKEQKELAPSGALVARFAQPGLNDGSFYMFNSGAGTSSTPYPAPVEILATDEAEKGLLYRYQTPGNSLYGALDDSGTLWLRVGRKLVKPLTPAQYRQVKP